MLSGKYDILMFIGVWFVFIYGFDVLNFCVEFGMIVRDEMWF